MGDKTLCKWSDKKKKENSEEYEKIVKDEKYKCKKCGNKVSKKKYACKPKEVKKSKNKN